MSKEIELRKEFFTEKEVVNSIYFGGGTPSVLHPDAIGVIIEKIYTYYSIHDNCEITLEINPEDVSEGYYHQLRKVGINRLSIGVQSFDDMVLRYLNRRHGAEHSTRSIEWAFNVGFDNVSIDLIYGIPGLTSSLWESTLNKTVDFPIKHISAYHLTIEPRTTFGYLKERGKFTEIEEEQSWQQMELLHVKLEEKGFEHYEISNFAVPGFGSRHNQSYWQNKKYLGFGPSAHSFDGNFRYENARDVLKYITAMNEGKPDISLEYLTLTERMNEEIMLRLRCREGLNKTQFAERFGIKHYLEVEKRARKFSPHFLTIVPQGIQLNLKGWFISDSIVTELFFVGI